jgi:hypothetical protein
VTLSLGSISVVLSALICVIGGITGLCKWRKKKKRGLEFEISARAQKKMET